MGLKILQISDLHIGSNQTKVTSEEVAHTIRNKEVDVILFLGDIIDGKASEGVSNEKYDLLLEMAVEFFNNLMEKINEKGNKLKKEDVLFIPGNHEIDRKNYDNKTLMFDKYQEFLRKFYDGKIPTYYNQKEWNFIRKYEEQKIVLLGFNSSNYGKINDKEEIGDYAEISSHQLYDAVEKLEAIENIEEYRIVACAHHHFYLVEERDKNYLDSTYIRNCETFLKKLSKFNLSLIIHGHKHASTEKRMVINSSIQENEKIATIFSSGSIGKKDVGRNFFRYIEVYNKDYPLELRNTTYELENSDFVEKPEFTIPLQRPNKIKSQMLEVLEKEEDLYKLYKDIRDSDTNTKSDKIIEIFDKTVGTIEKTSKIVSEDKRCVFLLLFAAHYRSNIYALETGILDKMNNIFGKLFHTYNAEFIKILESRDIYEFQSKYVELAKVTSGIKLRHLTFIAIGTYLSELFLALNKHSELFYNIEIRKKSDIIFDNNKLQSNISSETIIITSDEERRAIEVTIKCADASAHKVVSLILREFEILLNNLDKYFMQQGFVMYYVASQINKSADKQLESYTFSTYIPKLIPLLAGESIYNCSEVFARELIQNSIDALKMRNDINIKKECITINISKETNTGIQTFEIIDYGCGMNKYILERYFTSIGRSFYKSDDFDNQKEKLNLTIDPISQFGIGFLSCFLVGKKIEVKTKYWNVDCNEDETAWVLNIPNYDGCFFIEESDYEYIGTKIKVYEDKDKNKFDAKKIVNYIKKSFVNPVVQININDNIMEQTYNIPRFKQIEEIIEKTKEKQLLIFIPFENNNIKYDTNMENNFRDYFSKGIENPYGMFIYKKDNELYNENKIVLANEGIIIRENFLEDSIQLLTDNYFDIFINFSSNLIELDVSREILKKCDILDSSLKELSNYIIKLKSRLAEVLVQDKINTIPYFILEKLSDNYSFNNICIVSANEKFRICYRENDIGPKEEFEFISWVINTISQCSKYNKDYKYEELFVQKYKESPIIKLLYNLIKKYEYGNKIVSRNVKIVISKNNKDMEETVRMPLDNLARIADELSVILNRPEYRNRSKDKCIDKVKLLSDNIVLAINTIDNTEILEIMRELAKYKNIDKIVTDSSICELVYCRLLSNINCYSIRSNIISPLILSLVYTNYIYSFFLSHIIMFGDFKKGIEIDFANIFEI